MGCGRVGGGKGGVGGIPSLLGGSGGHIRLSPHLSGGVLVGVVFGTFCRRGGKPLLVPHCPFYSFCQQSSKKRREFVGKNCCAGPGSKVDAPELSSGPGWKIEEVSRAGAQRVTSKSKLLAQEMPDLHTGGLRADPGAARWLKGARAGQRVDRRGSYASV